MTEHAAARFVQLEVAQDAIFSNPLALLPQRLAWWRRNSSHDHITDLAFCVAGNGMNNFGATHVWTLTNVG